MTLISEIVAVHSLRGPIMVFCALLLHIYPLLSQILLPSRAGLYFMKLSYPRFSPEFLKAMV